MKFMFSTVYRVIQKDFYARPYTSMWAPVVARQISKRYSSSCHVFVSRGGTTAWPPRSPDLTPLDFFVWGFIKGVVNRRKVRDLDDLWEYHWSSWAYNTSHADKHVARAWIPFRYLSSYNRCPRWSVRTCIKFFLSYSVHCWKHKFHKDFRY